MSTMEQPPLAQLDALEKRLAFIEERAQASGDEDESYSKNLIQLLKKVCKVVRNADKSNASDLDALVAKAAQLIDRGIHLGYDGAGLFDFMPSFAHESGEDFVEDSLKSSMSRCIMILLSLLKLN